MADDFHLAMMIDLETLSLDNSAVIVSGGLVCGYLPLPADHAFELEYFLKLQSQKGRTVMLSTIEWWMAQVANGTAFPTSDTKIDLKEMLLDIQKQVELNKPDTIWSKGSDFDIKILEHAFKAEGLTIPWHYRQVRCFRTMEALYHNTMMPSELTKRIPGIEEGHGALSDARYQFRMLQEYWKLHTR